MFAQVVAAAQHDPALRVRPQQFARQVDARHSGQADVGDDDVEPVRMVGVERLLGACTQRDAAVRLLKQFADGRAQIVVVFDIEDRHGRKVGVQAHRRESLRSRKLQKPYVGAVLHPLAFASVRVAPSRGDRLHPVTFC